MTGLVSKADAARETFPNWLPERIANLAWEDFEDRQFRRASEKLREAFVISDFKDAVMWVFRMEVPRAILAMEEKMSEEQYTKAAVEHATENGGVVKPSQSIPTAWTGAQGAEVRFSEEARQKSWICPDVTDIFLILAADATTQLRAALRAQADLHVTQLSDALQRAADDAKEAEKAAYERGVAHGRDCERQDQSEWAPSTPPQPADLEKMQEAYKRALDTWNTNLNRKITERFASYLVAEGMTIGTPPATIADAYDRCAAIAREHGREGVARKIEKLKKGETP